MKAKEYAAMLIEAEDKKNTLSVVLEGVVYECMELCKKRNSIESKLGAVREGFSKWKSVVAQVKGANVDVPIEDSFFIKILSYANLTLYTLAYENKVFLGYEMDKDDVNAAARGNDEINRSMYQARMESMQREARRMGLDAGSFLREAAAMGLKFPSL